MSKFIPVANVFAESCAINSKLPSKLSVATLIAVIATISFSDGAVVNVIFLFA